MAPTGPEPQDFVQIEIEELQEVLDRCITDPDWFPDSIAEFVDPLDFPRLEPEPMGAPRLVFRRLVRVPSLMASGDAGPKLRRFLADWDAQQRRGVGSLLRPLGARHPRVPGPGRRGAHERQAGAGDPATRSRAFRVARSPAVRSSPTRSTVSIGHMGYPFAWYFHMLTDPKVSHRLAEAVHADLMGAYDYLPARDLKVLRDWYAEPYGV